MACSELQDVGRVPVSSLPLRYLKMKADYSEVYLSAHCNGNFQFHAASSGSATSLAFGQAMWGTHSSDSDSAALHDEGSEPLRRLSFKFLMAGKQYFESNLWRLA
eukprot:scaffold517209_cov40-Prasinocladus_malaysianus.AAC.1